MIGVTEFAGGAHLDLDSTIYGEIAFTPFRTWEVLGVEMARSIPLLGVVTAVNLLLLVLFWKELKATTFDPGFAKVNGISPTAVSRLILIAVAVTAVTAFESVGAILVVTMLIVPAAASYLMTSRLLPMVLATVGIGWISAAGGYGTAVAMDASIGGAMGLTAAAVFVIALLFSPKYGVVTKAVVRLRRRGRLEAPPATPGT